MQAIAVAADLERWELEPTGDRTPQEHASRDTVAVSAEVPVSDRVRELMRRTAEYEASLKRGRSRSVPTDAAKKEEEVAPINESHIGAVHVPPIV